MIILVVGVKIDDNATVGATTADQFVYSGFSGANVTLDGAAAVTPSGQLELTNGTLRQKAHAIHPAPLRFRRNQGRPCSVGRRGSRPGPPNRWAPSHICMQYTIYEGPNPDMC